MKDLISIEDSFQSIMLFFQDFWDSFLRERMLQEGLIDPELPDNRSRAQVVPKSANIDLLEDNNFFFLVVCIGTSSSDYFEEIIEKRMNIPATEQHHGLKITKKMLFQLTIDFCDYFNKRFQQEGRDSLKFAIDWLEDMRNHPQKHETEWNIWNKTIIDVIDNGQKSLSFF